MPIVHLFPGQGDFTIASLVRETRPGGRLRGVARQVYEQVDDVTAEHRLPALAPWLLGPHPPGGRELAEAPVGTSQLALFGASMTIHRALCASRGEPASLLGVSFGEIAALTAAGAFAVDDGARIAYDLAQVLATCPGGLTLLRCPEETAQTLIDLLELTGEAVVACVNDDRETIVSGPTAALEAVELAARGEDLAAVRLRLPFSSHHPGLHDQAKVFEQAVRAYPVAPLGPVVYSAVAGRAYTSTEDLPRRLADCLVRPSKLPQVLRLAVRSRPAALFEAGPGSALAGSARRVLAGPDTTVHAPLGDAGFRW
ncbi:hypothetical protein KCMC57_up55540 [Kitasatospora sp. CMC57]|uniref:[acyl-carrier-protein] S-malonyltransferase n=1 Tax=Kitasatospora sp. CMC57 TaxID=3231513 RepID=A0AB33KBC4_9ACTN